MESTTRYYQWAGLALTNLVISGALIFILVGFLFAPDGSPPLYVILFGPALWFMGWSYREIMGWMRNWLVARGEI